MPPDPILDDLLSGDPTRIWRGSGAVLAEPDGPGLARLVAARGIIATATRDVDLGGALVSNRRGLDLALMRLDLYAARLDGGDSAATCYCRILSQAMFMSPTSLSVHHRGTITRETINRDSQTTVTRVTCNDCGQTLKCVEETGWHVPTYRWSDLPQV